VLLHELRGSISLDPYRKEQRNVGEQNLDALNAEAQAIRLEIAGGLVERRRADLGEHLLAAAVYASVAHGAALPHSDVEVILLTDETVPAREDFCLERGILLEADMLPASRLLAAAGRVTRTRGIEADQYRHHLVLDDPQDIFPRVWEAANHPPDDAFAPALTRSWWSAFEMRGKMLNGALVGDLCRVLYHAWEFAYWAALRIALQERRPYESHRTLWGDVAARGYGMAGLVTALTEGGHERVTSAAEEVWLQTWRWGAPEGYAP
jgi:KNTase C-terminal domain